MSAMRTAALQCTGGPLTAIHLYRKSDVLQSTNLSLRQPTSLSLRVLDLFAAKHFSLFQYFHGEQFVGRFEAHL
jgi:hypothetical protein